MNNKSVRCYKLFAAFELKNNYPVCFKIAPGNTPDSKMLVEMCDGAKKAVGKKNIEIVMFVEVSAKPQGHPASPRNVKAAAGDSYVNLEWIAPSDDGGSLITNYNIYRDTTSGGETLLETVSNVLSYTDDDVINNQKYYYHVSAVNSAGEGEMSNEVGVEPKGDTLDMGSG